MNLADLEAAARQTSGPVGSSVLALVDVARAAWAFEGETINICQRVGSPLLVPEPGTPRALLHDSLIRLAQETTP